MRKLRVRTGRPSGLSSRRNRLRSGAIDNARPVSALAAMLGLLVTVGTASPSHAASILGANGSAGSDAGASGGTGGDGAGAPGSGGTGATLNAGGNGVAGTNGTGGGGGGGGLNLTFSPFVYPVGGAGGAGEFGAGGAAGTISGPPKGGGDEAGGGGAFGGSSSVDAGGGGGGGGGRGQTLSVNSATIQTGDTVTGGNGGAGGNGTGSFGDGGGGGGGGIGVVFKGTDTLTVNGAVSGGAGGAGGNGGLGFGASGSYSGYGGNGGSGLRATEATSTVIVNGSVTGGNGGANGISQFSPSRSRGGSGGNGLVAITIVNNGAVTGGTGGAASTGGGGGGAGGAGGIGAVVSGTAMSSNAGTGTLTGGNGGAGATAQPNEGGNGGNGGAGGAGLSLSAAGANFTNRGTITGGLGGAAGGGATSNTSDPGGDGGSGGAGGIAVAAAGATFVNLGTLIGGNGAAGGTGGTGTTPGANGAAGDGGAAVSGSNLWIINSGAITGGLSGDAVTRANAITFTGGTNTLELRVGSTITGNVVGTGNDILALGGSVNGTFNVATVGAGQQYQGFATLQKTGSSSWTVTGTQTVTAAWAVNAGLLSVNGDISSSSGVTVNAGGTLGGTGRVAATVINSGGALAPGNSIGTISVSGNLTFAAGASYNIEVSPSAADRTNVSGAAALAGTVNATYAPGSYTARQYTILSAAGGVTGSFNGLSNAGLPASLIAALGYDANNAYLNLTLNYVPPGGLNGNQQNVANALTGYFNSTGGIPTAFTALTANGLSQASGEPGAAVQQTIWTGSNLFMATVFDNAFTGAAAGTGAPGGGALNYAPQREPSSATREAYAAVTPRGQATAFQPRWLVWTAGYGGSARVSGDTVAGSHDTSSRVYGVAAGASWHSSPDSIVGFALGGAGSNFSIAQGLGAGNADGFNAALYGRREFGPSYLSAALAYAWQDATTDRTVIGGGETNALHASFHPQAVTARLEGGARPASNLYGFAPYAAVQTTTLLLPSYGETTTSGAGLFALSYASRSFTTARGEIGTRFEQTILSAGLPLTFKARLAWAHDWGNDMVATATFQQLPGATFTVNGARPAADSALVSFGTNLVLPRNWSAGSSFDGEFSRTTASYAGKASLRYAL